MCDNLDILKGRIWPAIQSCVGNRYKILLSFFAFYSFILTSQNISIISKFDKIKLYGSFLFSLFTFLNSVNYVRNSKEQSEKENSGATKEKNSYKRIQQWYKRNDIEIFFFVFMMVLIWGAYFLINDC